MAFILGFRVWLGYREKSESEAGFRNLKASERGNEMWHGLGLNWGPDKCVQRNIPIVWIVKEISDFFYFEILADSKRLTASAGLHRIWPGTLGPLNNPLPWTNQDCVFSFSTFRNIK
jgi:hypothetical protein